MHGGFYSWKENWTATTARTHKVWINVGMYDGSIVGNNLQLICNWDLHDSYLCLMEISTILYLLHSKLGILPPSSNDSSDHSMLITLREVALR